MSTDNDPNAPSSSGGGSTAAAMLNQPIVIDCGTASMKAGFAGGTKPKVSNIYIYDYGTLMIMM